jgi:hypothetical protein
MELPRASEVVGKTQWNHLYRCLCRTTEVNGGSRVQKSSQPRSISGRGGN